MVWFDPDLPVLRIHLNITGPTARLTARRYRARDLWCESYLQKWITSCETSNIRNKANLSSHQLFQRTHDKNCINIPTDTFELLNVRALSSTFLIKMFGASWLKTLRWKVHLKMNLWVNFNGVRKIFADDVFDVVGQRRGVGHVQVPGNPDSQDLSSVTGLLEQNILELEALNFCYSGQK